MSGGNFIKMKEIVIILIAIVSLGIFGWFHSSYTHKMVIFALKAILLFVVIVLLLAILRYFLFPGPIL